MKREHAAGGAERQRLNFKRMQIVIVLFVLLTIVLYLVQKSVSYRSQGTSQLELLAPETLAAAAAETAEQEPVCLLLWQDDPHGRAGRDLMEDVLDQTKVPFVSQEASTSAAEELDRYQTVVLAVDDLGVLGESVIDIMDWASSGGGLMLFDIPSRSGYLDLLFAQIGVAGMRDDYVVVRGLHFCRPFMLGGELRDYGITDPYESSVPVLLDSQSEVYIQSTGSDPVPILWRRPLGEGTVVVSNLDFADKIYRGFYAAAYSLLGDGFAWPVINGATFYIDDFPAPVPQGDDKHISKDYNMSVKDFMTQVWWPDVQQMALEHGVRYTGLVIELYSDETEAPVPANDDLNRYQYFGRSLLNMGGEIGFHGYNHMPLVLKNFDYRGEYDEYKAWGSVADMVAGVAELDRFCASLFPGEKFQVYVPPSNILSDEGRAMLHESFPQIKAVASTYLADGVCYDQEFEVAEDGVVETPRVISGYIMSDFMYLSAVAELNYRFVSTHFQHPDDVLDEDRGAALGWAEMSRRLDGYMDWLYTAAPDIRNLTGSELAAAVQRYDNVRVDRVLTEDAMTLTLDGFVDEVWLMVRLNGRQPGQVQGGELTELLDGLYLLRADESRVVIGLD